MDGNIEEQWKTEITGDTDRDKKDEVTRFSIHSYLSVTATSYRLLFEESSFELFGTKAGLCLPLLQKRLGDSGNRVSRHLYVNYLNLEKI